jgi:hypothetical protein
MRILTIILSVIYINCFALDEIWQKKADYEFKGLTNLAEQGDVDAQFRLGQMYQQGSTNVKKNPLEAVKWFRKASDQGNERAMCQLGYCYVLGLGLKKDMSEAVKWFRKAATLGSTGAYTFFANCYTVDNGIYLDSGLSKNDIEAYAYYILAGSGDRILTSKLTPSQIDAGKKRSEELRKQFTEEYLQQLKQKALQGDTKSQLILGSKYSMNVQGVPRDINEAIKWYTMAANKGNNEALMSLGGCYLELQNINEAINWYTIAADKGNNLALISVAQCYLGLKDPNTAIKWYIMAADKGNNQALIKVAQCYSNLNNYKEAIKWYSKALAMGITSARRSIDFCYTSLGSAYKNGRGVDKDLNEAYAYYKLAAASNPNITKQYLETLEKDMTPEQIEAGEKRAKEIQAEYEAK